MSEEKAAPLLNVEEGQVVETLEQQLIELRIRGYWDAASIYVQAMHVI